MPQPKPKKKKRLRLTRAVGRGGFKLVKSKVGILGTVGGGAYLAGKDSHAEWPQEWPYNNLPDTVSIKISQERDKYHDRGVIWWAEFLDNDQLGDMVGIDGPFPDAVSLVKQLETWAAVAGYGIDANAIGRMNSRGESIITASKKITPEMVRAEMPGGSSLNKEQSDFEFYRNEDFDAVVEISVDDERPGFNVIFDDRGGDQEFHGPYDTLVRAIQEVDFLAVQNNMVVVNKEMGKIRGNPLFILKRMSGGPVLEKPLLMPHDISLNKEQSDHAVGDQVTFGGGGSSADDWTDFILTTRYEVIRGPHVGQSGEVEILFPSIDPDSPEESHESLQTTDLEILQRYQHRFAPGMGLSEDDVVEYQQLDLHEAGKIARNQKDYRLMAHRMIKNPGFEDNKPLSLYPMQLPGTRRFSNNKEQPESSDFRGPVDDIISAVDRGLMPEDEAARRIRIFLARQGATEHVQQQAEVATKSRSWRTLGVILAGVGVVGGLALGSYGPTRALQRAVGSARTSRGMAMRRGQHRVFGRTKEERRVSGTGGILGRLLGRLPRRGQDIDAEIRRAENLARKESRRAKDMFPTPWRPGSGSTSVRTTRTTGAPGTGDRPSYRPDPERGFALGSRGPVPVSMGGFGNAGTPSKSVQNDVLGKAAVDIRSRIVPDSKKHTSAMLSKIRQSMKTFDEMLDELMVAGGYTPGAENRAANDVVRERFAGGLRSGLFTGKWSKDRDYQFSEFADGEMDEWIMSTVVSASIEPSSGTLGHYNVTIKLGGGVYRDGEKVRRMQGREQYIGTYPSIDSAIQKVELIALQKGFRIARDQTYDRGNPGERSRQFILVPGDIPHIGSAEMSLNKSNFDEEYLIRSSRGPHDITVDKDPRDNRWEWRLNGEIMGAGFRTRQEAQANALGWVQSMTKGAISPITNFIAPDHIKVMLPMTDPPLDFDSDDEIQGFAEGDTLYIDIVNIDSSNDLPPGHLLVGDHMGGSPQRTFGLKIGGDLLAWGWDTVEEVREWVKESILVGELVPGWMLTHDAFDQRNRIKLMEIQSYTSLNTESDAEFAEATADFTNMSGVIHAQVDETGAWWDWKYQLTKDGSPVDLQIGSSLSFDRIIKDVNQAFVHGWGEIVLVSSSPTEATFRVVFNPRRIIASFDEGDEEKSEFAAFSTAIIKRVADSVYTLVKTNSEGVTRKASFDFLTPEDAIEHLRKQEIVTSEKIVNHYFDPVTGETRVLLRGPDMPDIFQEHSDFRLSRAKKIGGFGKSAGEHLYETKRARRTRRRWRRRIKRKLHI